MPRRYFHRHQDRQCLTCWAKAGIGVVVALGIIAVLDQFGGAPLLAAPLGASAVLVFGMPDSPLSQPASVIGSHLLATAVGLAFDQLLPGGGWVAMALAVAVVMVLLAALRLTHPPAGADPLVVMMAHPGWGFLVMPVLVGTLTLVAVAVLIHRLPPRRSTYPLPVRPAREEV